MRFFFADSQDLVNPTYDFQREAHDVFRLRQRDDRYPHEMLARVPYDGILVSKSIVDGVGGSAGRYTLGQRLRLRRLGVRGFFRLPQTLATMGDCGAFTYVDEPTPPYTVDEVLDFYEECGFDLGVSVDHVILGFDPTESAAELPAWKFRRELTLHLAREFFARHARRGAQFVPVGVAQGWSPASYAESVAELARIGYRRIALGGMVPLRTDAILSVLAEVASLGVDAEFHLLGVTRVDHISDFARYGVTSFDSTSPLRQAFMDDDDNYYWEPHNFTAIRVPPSEANSKVRLRIRAGQLDHDTVLRLERRALEALRAFDRGEASVALALDSVRAYSELVGERKDRRSAYRSFLTERPWKTCMCGVCGDVGIEVAIFRGAERNRRRGFHNLHVFRQRISRATATPTRALAEVS